MSRLPTFLVERSLVFAGSSSATSRKERTQIKDPYNLILILKFVELKIHTCSWYNLQIHSSSGLFDHVYDIAMLHSHNALAIDSNKPITNLQLTAAISWTTINDSTYTHEKTENQIESS